MMSPDDEVESANNLRRGPHVRTRSLKFDAPVNDDESIGKNVDLVTPIKENEQMAMAASLPKLFNTINSLFRSGRSVMTKEEVIHKIIAAHLEVVNRGEVEQQLKMLGEVIPEWISERTAFSGDSLFCINKLSSSAAMRARLEEAFPVTCPKEEASLGLGIAV
ncbi:CDT1-like protein a, chloroplastic [Linum grandiflorum]